MVVQPGGRLPLHEGRTGGHVTPLRPRSNRASWCRSSLSGLRWRCPNRG